MDHLTLERRGPTALITLQSGKVNAISSGLLRDLRSAIDDIAKDLPALVVVTGSETFFCAGADISEFGGQDQARTVTEQIHETLDALAALPRLVLAVISGYALGGGCELALACDLRIGTDTAVLGQPEIKLGIIPGGGGTQRLPRLVGPAKAKEMMITGRQVKAEEALQIGLLDEIVPGHENALWQAFAVGEELAKGPAIAQGLVKRAVDEGMSLPLAQGLALERDLFVEVFGTEDSQIGIQSFLQQGPGKAQFTGR
jgi:enoyl-CoA hydratase/carnithine racemase